MLCVLLRFILWAIQHGENPGLLDLSNLDAILGGEYLSARQFDSHYALHWIKVIQGQQSEL